MTTSERPMLIFPSANPEGAVRVRLSSEKQIEGVPTWSLQTVNLGPPRSSPVYERHLRDTVGSSYDWSDEFRFDKHTGQLVSFVLKTPESGLIDSALADSWLRLPRHVGVPVLEDCGNAFHVDPLDLRHFSRQEDALVAACTRMPFADSRSLRLAIVSDLDLLFFDTRYCGWILRRPLGHLVADPGDLVPGGNGAEVQDLLSDYLSLVIEPNITRMSDEDPTLRAALNALHARAQTIDAVQGGVIESAVERLIETFYPG